MKQQIVVIGRDANALVAAHFLARADHGVTLVLDSETAGDETLEIGWVPPHLVRELDLRADGFELYDPDSWAVIPLPTEPLELTRDVARTADAIGRLSLNDAAKWAEFCDRMHALATLLEPLYCAPPPDPLVRSWRGIAELLGTALRVRSRGRRAVEDLLRILPMSAADLLDEWFESDILKGVLAGAAVYNLCQGPRSGGTAFNFLHHHVGSRRGVFRPPLSNLSAVLNRRTEVETRSEVLAGIAVREGRVTGVVLQSGEPIQASVIVSALAPGRTLLDLVDSAWLEPQLVRAVRNIRARGVAANVLLTIDREPRFDTLVVAPSMDYLERAYDSAKYGQVPDSPYIEARYIRPAANGRHHVNLHVQYVPHAMKEGAWNTARSETFGRAVIDRLSEHVPGFSGWVIGMRVLTPHDFEHMLGYPQGQAYHAELALDQVLWMRPVPELAQYRTPIEGLYLCGPAMHPGGGISGAAGANAASVVLLDLKKRKTR